MTKCFYDHCYLHKPCHPNCSVQEIMSAFTHLVYLAFEKDHIKGIYKQGNHTIFATAHSQTALHNIHQSHIKNSLLHESKFENNKRLIPQICRDQCKDTRIMKNQGIMTLSKDHNNFLAIHSNKKSSKCQISQNTDF